MSDKAFDELFRIRLKDHPSAVPEDMWQRIGVEADDRKRFGLWRWYFVGPVVLLAGLLFGPRIWRVSQEGSVGKKWSRPQASAAVRQSSSVSQEVAAKSLASVGQNHS